MNINSRIISMLALLILMISISVPDVAALLIKKNLTDLTKDADSIVVGNVTEKKSYKENGMIFTDVTISVDMRLKGKNDINVVVKVPGGTVGGLHEEVSDAPFFEKGQHVLLFSNGKDVVGMNQGKFTIYNGKIIETDEPLPKFVQKIKEEAKIPFTRGQTGRSIGVMSQKLNNRSLIKIPANSSQNNSTVEPPVRNDALSNIKYEGFEATFPNAWISLGSPTWCKTSYKAAVGSYSGWPACAGTGAVAAGGYYPSNLDSWIIYGPFDLTGATDAIVTFKQYTDTEFGFDFFVVAASTTLYGVYNGNYWTGDYSSSGWMDTTFDLKTVPGIGDLRGQPAVYVAFIFQSDSWPFNADYGTFLDEIVISKDTTPSTIPHITGVAPISGPAKAANLTTYAPATDSTQVTITGTNFSATEGSVKFWRWDTEVYNAAIESWTDTQIVARVPGGISSWARPGGSGNVQVVNSAGIPSDNYGNFRVTYSYAGGKWPGTGFTYKVNPNTGDTADELAAVQAAANTWNNAGANFVFTYGGITTISSIYYDSENSIIWSPGVGPGILAQTSYWYFTAAPQIIVETDVEFNDDYLWSTNGAAYDIQTIGTHELGHGLSLLDMYGTQDSSKMMYGFGDSGTINRDLNVADVDGIKAIYGAASKPTGTITGRVSK